MLELQTLRTFVDPRLVAGLALLLPSLLFIRKTVRRHLLRKFTIVPDLDGVGAPRAGGKIAGTAVICGGSFGGLFTARICADHFKRVVVIEPEAWTFTEEARSVSNFGTREVQNDNTVYNTIAHKRTRVSQYTGNHIYHIPVLRFARKMFPGFDAIARRWVSTNIYLSGYPVPAPFGPDAPEVLAGPRRDVEPLFRKLARETCPNVEFVQGLVDGFDVTEGSGNAISSVSVRLPDGSSKSLSGDLIADCAGPSALGLKLLSRLYPALANVPALREEYNPNTAFSSLEFPVAPNFLDNVRAMKIPRNDGRGLIDVDRGTDFWMYVPDPTIEHRLIGIGRIKPDRVGIIMGGWNIEPPVSLAEARRFAEQAPFVPDFVFKILDLLEPVADKCTATPIRSSTCWKIRFENAGHILPRNFVAIGDATMRVNSRFGQGVTKALMGAVTLDGVLREHSVGSKNLSRTYFVRLASRTANIWNNTKYADYGHPSVTPAAGETLQSGWFSRALTRKLLPVVSTNETAARTLFDSLHFLVPPTDMLHVTILASLVREVLWPSPSPSP
ncbi:hypothetical protein EXIGLDRAFT_778065 [Exidia glandulosa HHB12029]|uniref:FAD/NAD(P)-binding domain-containing protein n=1 Tax=Exidia glandulosa HHB12029 TaxID=1314781 RepID=A0A165CQU5_EXIGL|nr:hypothetical protein EXIGLDRAFT_778065 [Exidia glandulosa HHB12029]